MSEQPENGRISDLEKSKSNEKAKERNSILPHLYLFGFSTKLLSSGNSFPVLDLNIEQNSFSPSAIELKGVFWY